VGSSLGQQERSSLVTEPSRRDRFRPLELLIMSAIVAVFVGLVVAGSTREIVLGAIFMGVAFIVTLVTLATLAITTRPDDAEISDLDDQDRAAH
jgi:undecaprenyl pyrophosphate phosphatase UppP